MEDNSVEFQQLSDRLLGPAEQKLHEFHRKAAGMGFAWVKQTLMTASEPFFRIGMGDRYFTVAGLTGGAILWFLGSCFGLVTSLFHTTPFQSLGAILFYDSRFHRIEQFFSSPWDCVISGLVMCTLHIIFSVQNLKLVSHHRRQGMLYHSMSRGVSRFDNPRLFGMILVGVLFVFNTPVAALFVAAIISASAMKAMQDAAIHSKYLDAIDQRVEQLLLKDAALGTCPPELTYLYEPLDPASNSVVREDTAAALVGEPVRGMAQPPKSKKSSTGASTSSREFLQEADFREKKITVQDVVANYKAPLQLDAKKFWIAMTLILVPLIGLFLGIASISSHLRHAHAPVKTGRTQPPVNYDGENVSKPFSSNDSSPTAPTVSLVTPLKKSAPEPPSVKVHIAQVPEQPFENPVSPEEVAALRERRERQMELKQAGELLGLEKNRVEKFKDYCNSQLVQNTNRIADTSMLDRPLLRRENKSLLQQFQESEKYQEAVLQSMYDQMESLSNNANLMPAEFRSTWQSNFLAMYQSREGIFLQLSNLDSQISKAPEKGQFLFFNFGKKPQSQ